MGKLINLCGKRFGRLKVIKRAKSEIGHGKHAVWECLCACGNKAKVRSNLLRTGNTKSCGCLARSKDLVGKRFGEWVVLERRGSDYYNATLWRCQCDCGQTAITWGQALLKGKSKSCGHNNKYNGQKHGLSGTPEYNRITLSKRKARRLAGGGDHTAQEVLDLLENQKGRCYYCGIKLTAWHQEHKTPLSRGGSDNISNIVISCPPCNWRKRDKTEEEFKTFLSDTKISA